MVEDGEIVEAPEVEVVVISSDSDEGEVRPMRGMRDWYCAENLPDYPDSPEPVVVVLDAPRSPAPVPSKPRFRASPADVFQGAHVAPSRDPQSPVVPTSPSAMPCTPSTPAAVLPQAPSSHLSQSLIPPSPVPHKSLSPMAPMPQPQLSTPPPQLPTPPPPVSKDSLEELRERALLSMKRRKRLRPTLEEPTTPVAPAPEPVRATRGVAASAAPVASKAAPVASEAAPKRGSPVGSPYYAGYDGRSSESLDGQCYAAPHEAEDRIIIEFSDDEPDPSAEEERLRCPWWEVVYNIPVRENSGEDDYEDYRISELQHGKELQTALHGWRWERQKKARRGNVSSAMSWRRSDPDSETLARKWDLGFSTPDVASPAPAEMPPLPAVSPVTEDPREAMKQTAPTTSSRKYVSENGMTIEEMRARIALLESVKQKRRASLEAEVLPGTPAAALSSLSPSQSPASHPLVNGVGGTGDQPNVTASCSPSIPPSALATVEKMRLRIAHLERVKDEKKQQKEPDHRSSGTGIGADVTPTHAPLSINTDGHDGEIGDVMQTNPVVLPTPVPSRSSAALTERASENLHPAGFCSDKQKAATTGIFSVTPESTTNASEVITGERTASDIKTQSLKRKQPDDDCQSEQVRKRPNINF